MAFKGQRWTLANILPIFFMLTLISSIWMLYMRLHIWPLLTGEASLTSCGTVDTSASPAKACIDAGTLRGVVEGTIQQALTIMLVVCFGRAILTDPGSVPDEPEWLPDWSALPNKGTDSSPEEIGGVEKCNSKSPPLAYEVKHSGARRFCKWCNRFKPDRSHHCRVCRSCILRMDHHCPWIANCVGFRNHKYFILLVFYSLLDCLFVASTMTEALFRSLVDEIPFHNRFLLVFCMTLASMMGFLLVLFSMFHAWLMVKATTTIEFCEKTYKHAGSSFRGSQWSIYDRGCLENVFAVLGPNPWCWLLPVATPEGDGLSFSVAKALESDDSQESEPLLPKGKKSRDNTGGACVKDDTESNPKMRESPDDSHGPLVPDTEAAPEVSGMEASIS